MIVLVGVLDESPLARVHDRIRSRGLAVTVLDQREFGSLRFEYEISCGRIEAKASLRRKPVDLDEVSGIYCRLMDPALAGDDPNTAASTAATYHAVSQWCDLAPARVANRSYAMGSNGSKPYQAQVIRAAGLSIPTTRITNDPTAAREFIEAHGRVIYKSASGVRSIVRDVDAAAMETLDRIRGCPTQFQAFVEGTNVRVHVVDDCCFATRIETEATDYRYGARDGLDVELSATELPASVAERCVSLSRTLGLLFAGVDLKLTPEGEWYCFEVNPSPAFSYYEDRTGQPIANALVDVLGPR